MSKGSETHKNKKSSRSKRPLNSPDYPSTLVQNSRSRLKMAYDIKDFIIELLSKSEKAAGKLISEKTDEVKQHIDNKVQLLQTELTVVENKVQQLETRDKRRNIIVHGIADINKETWKHLNDCIKIYGENFGIEISILVQISF